MTILRHKCILDSFVQMSLLPFSDDADTGQFFADRGMGLVPIFAPLHKMNITCGLLSGEVIIPV